MNEKKQNNYKLILYKLILFSFIICILGWYSIHEVDNQSYEIENTAYLYETDELIGVNIGNQASELAGAATTIANEIKANTLSEDGDNAYLNTSVISTPSLLKFDITEEEQEENIKYVKENTKLLEKGYTVTVDNEYSFYIPDEELLQTALEEVYLAYVPDETYLEYYQTTGNFKEYTEGDYTYTGLDIDNSITLTEGYSKDSVYIETSEDLIFELFHKNQNVEYEEISDDLSISAITEENELTTTEFKLNNPGITSDSIVYNGQKVIVNKTDPIINVKQTAESSEIKEVDYETIEEEDDTMLTGQFEVTTEGKEGSKEVTYENIIVNGELVETNKTNETVIEKPVHEVIAVGEGTSVNSITVSDEAEESGAADVASSASGMIWPSSSQTVSCEYMGYSGHTGIDIQSYYGGPEYAAASGTVVTSGWSNIGYGYHVVIDHGNGVETLYAHQSQQPPVSVGQTVEQGQVIGFEGATGNVTGEHLHFEVRINGTAVNPRPYITSEPAYNMGTVC